MPQPKISAQYFRLQPDVSTPAAALKDQYSGVVPVVATGAAVEFDFGFSDGALADGTILDLSVFDSVDFRIQSNGSPHANTVYITASIIAANFQNLDTAAHWTDKSKQQITVAISAAQNILQPTTGSTGNYWLCVYGKLSAVAALAAGMAAGDAVPLCYFQINVIDSGIPIVNPALPQPFKVGTKVPFVCADGFTRDLTLGNGPGGIWVSQVNQAGYNGVGQAFYSLYCADGNWRDLSLQLQDGSWVLAINQNGHN
jgi:hypothetical protein